MYVNYSKLSFWACHLDSVWVGAEATFLLSAWGICLTPSFICKAFASYGWGACHCIFHIHTCLNEQSKNVHFLLLNFWHLGQGLPLQTCLLPFYGCRTPLCPLLAAAMCDASPISTLSYFTDTDPPTDMLQDASLVCKCQRDAGLLTTNVTLQNIAWSLQTLDFGLVCEWCETPVS